MLVSTLGHVSLLPLLFTLPELVTKLLLLAVTQLVLATTLVMSHYRRSIVVLKTIHRFRIPQSVFTITEKAPTRAFSWLKATTTSTFKNLLRHYSKLALTHSKIFTFPTAHLA